MARLGRQLLTRCQRVGFELVQFELLAFDGLLVAGQICIRIDIVLRRSSGELDLVHRSGCLWRSSVFRCSHRIAIERVVQHLVFLISLCSQCYFYGILALRFERLPRLCRIRIGVIRQQLELLIDSISGAKHGTEFIRVGIEKTELAEIRAQVVGVLRKS